MEKFGFHKVTGGSSGSPTISHNRPHQPPPPTRQFRKELKVANCPQTAMTSCALGNRVAVLPLDFPEIPNDTPILMDGQFVYSIYKDESTVPGTIGLAGHMRLWGRWSLDQVVRVGSFNIFQNNQHAAYLGAAEISVDFKSRSKAHDRPIKHDQLVARFLATYENQVLQPSQPIVMDFEGNVLQLVVTGVQVIDLDQLLADVHMETRFDAKGILIQQTKAFFAPREGSVINISGSGRNRPRANPIINPDFKLETMGIGGLEQEFSQIFRRAFASRIISPDLVEKLALRHVKGLLLYGPPGTGKTLIARQIGKMLNVKEPKVVNGPEMLSKYVGASEENIRNLFKDAEQEYKQKGENSQLHIIIFDELDSVFKQRGLAKSDGTGVGDNVVNQLLAKMDGVDQLNNILIIGMTNRLDLIDNALLRPGRFEIQIEISLPDEKGRRDILAIHTAKMRENNLLAPDVDLGGLASLTKNFTAAELEGLCNSATSFAINKHTKTGSVAQVDTNIEKMQLTRNDFLNALNEVRPAFGVNEEDLAKNAPHGIIPFSLHIGAIFDKGRAFIDEVKSSETERLISILFHGAPGSGKTAIALTLALQSEFPFIKMLSAESLVGMLEPMKIATIDSTFRDVYKSPLNILVIDKIETLINYVPIGPRFSNDILQTLMVSLTKQPPNGRRLLIIGTTSQYSVLKHMNLVDCFTNTIAVNQVTQTDELMKIMEKIGFMSDTARHQIVQQLEESASSDEPPLRLGVKKLLQVLMNARYLKADVPMVVENIIEAHMA